MIKSGKAFVKIGSLLQIVLTNTQGYRIKEGPNKLRGGERGWNTR